jgi:hypothetical protein
METYQIIIGTVVFLSIIAALVMDMAWKRVKKEHELKDVDVSKNIYTPEVLEMLRNYWAGTAPGEIAYSADSSKFVDASATVEVEASTGKVKEVTADTEEPEHMDLIKEMRENPHLNMPLVHQRFVAVLSLNAHDFLLWKYDSNFKDVRLETQKRFIVDNTTYFCASDVYGLRAFALDEIIETEHAKENKEYEQMKLAAQSNLNKW